ncbi:MAG: DnaD domain protein [Peptococcaceae bacterium]|nr:DnaD domain protein [Peptococcaceae bacterium]
MTTFRNGKIVKCDQKVNITATFGSDLVLEGFTSVPNILLKVYRRIGISDFQAMVLIHLIRLRVEERNYYPAPETIAQYMDAEAALVQNTLEELQGKEIIAVSEYYDNENNVVFEGYDFEPLFLKVSDVWAAIRAKEIEDSEKNIKAAGLADGIKSFKYSDSISELIITFEKEFGRPLSPIEVEQIEKWAGESSAALVVEALRRAVLGGKHNFKYINSILLEWKKNNLKTLEEVSEYDQDFQKRRARSLRKVNETANAGTKANKNDSKEKAFIRSLYIKG